MTTKDLVLIKTAYLINNISVMESISKVKNGEVPFIMLWSNSDRNKDEINTLDECDHIVEEDMYCTLCGGFVGHVGVEPDWDTYFLHVITISNILKHNNFYIATHKYIPEYITYLDKKFHTFRMSHHRETTYLRSENMYITHFYPKVHKQSCYTLQCYPHDIVRWLSFKSVGISSIINPSKKVFTYGKKYVDKIYICNTGVNYDNI